MKRFTLLAGVAGLLLLSVVVGFSGAADVAEAVAAAGWATALVVAARAVALAGAGLAWRYVVPPAERVSAPFAVQLRWIREAVNQLLPVAAVGGDFVGARVATFRGMDGAMSGASVIVDVAIQAATQLVFALLGLVLLLALVGDNELAHYAAAGLAVAALGIAAFFLVQRREGSRLFRRLLTKAAGGREWGGVAALDRLYARLGEIYRGRAGIAACVALHSAMWLFGAVEVYLALDFMGHPVTIAEALVIESLGQAVRGAAFAVPGGLGVQEGGFVALCALFGVPPGPAVALSLVKRVADVALGVPGLVMWQWMEGRRLLGGRPEPLAEAGR